MSYVDGFVVPVPKKNMAAYKRMAEKAGKIWKEYGALTYVECVAEDAKVGKLTSFPQSVKLEPGETVVFSWITYKSRAHRDKVNAKVMKDPRMAEMMNPKKMPFDGKRMIYGGFETFLEMSEETVAHNGATKRAAPKNGHSKTKMKSSREMRANAPS